LLKVIIFKIKIKMDLKTQINILTSTSKEGVYNLIWKDEMDLLKQIENISQSFQNSSEEITNSNTIIFLIINEYKDRIGTYGGMEFDTDSFNKHIQDSEVSDNVMKAINSILKSEDSKKGNHILTLTSDEIYQLFSLQEVRNSKLDQIL
jgi:hypothetical protein